MYRGGNNCHDWLYFMIYQRIIVSQYEDSKILCKWTYLQSRYRLTDIESKLMITKQESGGGIN